MKRAKWKGFYLKKSLDNEASLKLPRNTMLIPKYVDQMLEVHNGKHYKKVKILSEMVGHKLGEFYKTRVIFEYKKKKKKKK